MKIYTQEELLELAEKYFAVSRFIKHSDCHGCGKLFEGEEVPEHDCRTCELCASPLYDSIRLCKRCIKDPKWFW